MTEAQIQTSLSSEAIFVLYSFLEYKSSKNYESSALWGPVYLNVAPVSGKKITEQL